MRPISVAALVAGSALVAALFSVPTAAAATDSSPHEISVPSAKSVLGDLKKFPSGKYIVRLKDSPASTYTGGISGYSATKPSTGKQLNAKSTSVKSYSALLEGKQEDLASRVGVKALYNYTLAFNGFAAELTSEEAARLAKSSSVSSVTPNEILKVQAASAAVPEPETSGEYLKITTPGGLWDSIGGSQNAGKGVVVGVLDTGIAPENPSFSGDALGTTASTNKPYLSGNNVLFAKGDGNTFSSSRVEGEQFDYSDYSTKIVGAKYFVDGFGEGNIGDAETNGEYLSPRDGDSHGSHTGSTAVGNADVDATVSGTDFGSIAGVAPAAKIAAYKVCWSGPDPDPDIQTDDGCATLDIVAAIDQAVADGVDVINYSIGGGSAQTVYSASDEAFLNAAAAGIFVSASAGNDGPGASTLDNAAPWETTVAASTIPGYEATLELGDNKQYVGASISVDRTPGAPELTGDLVLAETAPAAEFEPAEANLCLAGSLTDAVAGKIVVCDRGNNGRLAKSVEVARAGGIGMVLLNVDAGDTITDDHVIPAIHVDAPYRAAVRAYAATAGATATFHPGNITGKITPVPQLAGFSSHGPVLAAGSDVLKPDVTAPGVSILAAGANAEGEDPTYEFLSGTSMSAPHVTGLAALYLGEKPLASPAEIKSALSTTATDTVNNSSAKTTDPFGQGAGQVVPTRYLNPGLLYLSGLSDWKRYLVGTGEASFTGVSAIDPSNLNLPSIAIGDLTGKQTITRTVTSTGAGTWTPTISISGLTTKVSPSSLKFTAAGQSKSYTVSFERRTASFDKFKTGFLTWTKSGSSKSTVRIPLAIHPTSVKAPESVSGEGTSGSTSVEITPGRDGSIAIDPRGLAQGVLTPNADDPTLPYTDVALVDDDESTPSSRAYVKTVPEGTEFVRFDVEPLTDSIETDLDLYIFYAAEESDDLDDYDLIAQSATGSAGESVEIPDPEAGSYVSYVDYFSTPDAGAPYKDLTYILNPATDVGNLTAVPATVKGVAGKPASFDLRWGGLAANSFFLGFVYYEGSPAVTNLYVETGDTLAPKSLVKPVIIGDVLAGETVEASPGSWDAPTNALTLSYQWLAGGEAIEGATESTFVIPDSLVGEKLSVLVTAKVDEDGPETVAASASTVVKAASTTTFALAANPISHTANEVVTVTVVTDPISAPTGNVTVTFGGSSKTVALKASDEGTVAIKLPKIAKKTVTIKVSYAGSTSVAPSKAANQSLVVK